MIALKLTAALLACWVLSVFAIDRWYSDPECSNAIVLNPVASYSMDGMVNIALIC